jgi:hypothetical protein
VLTTTIRGSSANISHTLDWISWGNLAKNGKSLGGWKLIVMVEEAVSWLRDWDRKEYDPLLDAGICVFPLYEDSS